MKQKKQKKQRRTTRPQFQGTKQERAAHFAAVAKAKKLAAVAAANPNKANTTAARAAVQAAGPQYVNKQTTANLTKAETVFAKRSAAAKKGAATRAAKKKHAEEVHAHRVAGAKKAAETRARNREIKLNAQYGQEVSRVRGMLILASLQRREKIAMNPRTMVFVTALKQAGYIPQDIRDIYGGKGITGNAPEMGINDLEKYWTHDRVKTILDKIGFNTVLNAKMGAHNEPVSAYNVANQATTYRTVDITTRAGREAAILAKQTTTPNVVSVTDIKDLALYRRLKSKLFAFYNSIGWESNQVVEAVKKCMLTLGGQIEGGVLKMDIDSAIDAATAKDSSLDPQQAAADKKEIKKLRGQLSTGSDLLTDTKDGEILSKIVDILGKYGL